MKCEEGICDSMVFSKLIMIWIVGLVPYYTLEDMQDRKVIVVANLLPRKLVGFKSNGMVLCASSTGEDGKERVEFIDPPLSSVPGRVP